MKLLVARMSGAKRSAGCTLTGMSFDEVASAAAADRDRAPQEATAAERAGAAKYVEDLSAAMQEIRQLALEAAHTLEKHRVPGVPLLRPRSLRRSPARIGTVWVVGDYWVTSLGLS